jgi:hypothetical protein
MRNRHFRNGRLPDSLPPKGYRQLLADIPHCIVTDQAVVERYLRKLGPSLARSEDSDVLDQAHRVSVVASHRSDVFRDYGAFAEWPHAEGHLCVNPLYVPERPNGEENVHLRLEFPNAWYEEENSPCKAYMPQSAVISADAWNALSQRQRTLEIEKLISQFVLMELPEKFGRPRRKCRAGAYEIDPAS